MYPEDYDEYGSDYNRDYKNTDEEDYYISLNNCGHDDFTNYMVWETDMTDNLQ
ncbi:MAG: hypothetical protein ACI4E1_10550 [Lachnospira sp.]